MSDKNDSGGGCLLFLIHWVFSTIRKRRIRKYNRQARGVDVHSSAAVDALLPPGTYGDNIIVSGGDQGERLRVCEQALRNAQSVGHPVIVLHAANSRLENIITRSGLGAVVNASNKLFDGFASLEFHEIVQIVTDTCKARYEIKPPGRYILQVVYELLAIQGTRPYFAHFANCPFLKLRDQIASRLSTGRITQDVADKLNSLLLTGQTECQKVDAFFSDMKSQLEYMSATSPSSTGAEGILSAIKKKQILSIDIRSSSNTMLLEFLVNTLVIAMNRGYDFTLLLDDIPFTSNDFLKSTVCQRSNHRNIILSKDLYSLVGGKDETFNTIVGGAERAVLFAHSSSSSCDKWSKYLGEYEKIDVSYNDSGGFSQSSNWGYNSHYGQTETLKREHKVKPEEIRTLSQNEAFIFDNMSNRLFRTFVV